MRRLVTVAALIVAGCVVMPPAPPVADNASRILITVDLDPATSLHGSPGRFFAYTSGYTRAPRARKLLRRLARDYGLQPSDAWPIQSLGVYCQVFVVAKPDTDVVIDKLRSDDRIESVQRMNEFETLTGRDSYHRLQSSLEQLQITSAHRYATGRNVRVAVIDTHVDSTHPQLKDRVTAQHNVLPAKHPVADVHGTAVAGIIGAQYQGGDGILGVAPDARIIALTACWPMPGEAGRCNSFTLARALDLAIGHDADVINLSLSGPSDALLGRLVTRALAAGAIVVGAHDPRRNDAFPVGVAGVLSVASVAHSDGVLVAPGRDVLTTVPGGGYDFLSGNSFAAAHVSGVAALAREARPALRAGELVRALSTATKSDGQINACATLDALNKTYDCSRNVAVTSPASD